MKKLTGIIILIMTILFLPVYIPAGTLDNYLTVVTSDSDGLILDLSVPEPDIEEVLEEGVLYHKIKIPGFVHTSQVGSPQLLRIGALIGIPENVKPSIEVLETESILLTGYNVYPAPKPTITEDSESRRLIFEFTLDKEIYRFNGFMPSSVAKINYTGLMREQKVVRVLFFPFQFNPVKGKLRYYLRIRVKINFNVKTVEKEAVSVKGKDRRGRRFKGKDNAYERLLKGVLLNYDQIRQKKQK